MEAIVLKKGIVRIILIEFVFNIKEKDNYKLIVEPIIKYKIPIRHRFYKRIVKFNCNNKERYK